MVKSQKILKGKSEEIKRDRQYNGKKLEDTKGVIRSSKSKDRQYNDQKCEETKEVIRSSKSKDRQYNDQKKKDKRTNNDLQNITQNQKLSNINILPNNKGELKYSERVSSSFYTTGNLYPWLFCIYSETCLNQTSLGPTFVFGLYG